jgi:outer membrane protein TolC
MGLGSLTPAERQQFISDMKQIKDNPQLVTAREAVKQAMQSLDQTRSTLLLQVDPSIQPVLTKIQQARQNHGNHGGPDDQQGPPPPPPAQN